MKFMDDSLGFLLQNPMGLGFFLGSGWKLTSVETHNKCV